MRPTFSRLIPVLLLFMFATAAAHADVWRWTDAHGVVHFVDTLKPIFTWVDENDRVYFSDTPDHEDAVSVELIWHSSDKTVDEAQAKLEDRDDGAYPGETAEERHEREQAEAYYCKRAQEIYDSYKNAPRLYKTTDSGERVYLSDEEAEATLNATKARVDELCG